MSALLIAGHPAVDFLNTRYGPEHSSTEVIGDGRSYLQWFVDAQLLDEEAAARLLRRCGTKALTEAADEAREIREWARGWLDRWRKRPRDDYSHEVAKLNRLIKRQDRVPELTQTRGEFQIVEQSELSDASGLIGLVALQMAQLVSNEQTELVKHCAGLDCTLWFLDRTKAHKRVFCSAATCGNRAKVAAFRERQRASRDPD